MNNIQVAKETMRITEDGAYEVSGRKVTFNKDEHTDVKVYSPEDGEALLGRFPEFSLNDNICRFTVMNSDSFEAAKDLEKPYVMNFANAHNPGGGFLLGSPAQEEALCRCSTLYASISSSKASPMYRYNNTHLGRVESDYMLLSENVLVFRNANLELLEEPFTAGVVTVPAPNKRGAAMLAPSSLIEKTMLRRIRILLLIAAENGYRNRVLGAWGCGAFGNDPKDVAGYFKQVLVDERYGFLFDEVRFAVYGKEDGRNITEFRNAFA